MRAVVLYRSISGFTRKYAQWIAQELGADLYDCRKVKLTALSGYDLVVFGGSLREGGINGIDTIKRGFAALEGKRIVIFATGGSSAREGIAEEISAANFSEEQRRKLRLFYFRGGLDIGKLGIGDRILMAHRKRSLLRKRSEDLTPDEKDFLAACANPADGTEKEKIRALVDYARS
jgi:menaquinone-dependent protoporphyrinogen IX oxidase